MCVCVVLRGGETVVRDFAPASVCMELVSLSLLDKKKPQCVLERGTAFVYFSTPDDGHKRRGKDFQPVDNASYSGMSV